MPGGRRSSATIESMTVPSRPEAASLLASLDPPTWFLAHACAVADIAAWLAARARAAGTAVDRRAVEAAALLHDVDKILPASDPARALPHGEGSAAWLRRQGHPELGPLVADHPVTRLADGAAHQRWAAGASPEARIVAYADKRAGQRLEPMADRFAAWSRRYPDSWDAATGAAVQERAARLEREVCRLAASTPDAVRRLPWSRAALRAVARAARDAA
ncbi:MAG: HD domain-containing protein [Candidatus Limnocylindria bacterium]